MTFVLIAKGLLLEGWIPKIEDSQVPGNNYKVLFFRLIRPSSFWVASLGASLVDDRHQYTQSQSQLKELNSLKDLKICLFWGELYYFYVYVIEKIDAYIIYYIICINIKFLLVIHRWSPPSKKLRLFCCEFLLYVRTPQRASPPSVSAASGDRAA